MKAEPAKGKAAPADENKALSANDKAVRETPLVDKKPGEPAATSVEEESRTQVIGGIRVPAGSYKKEGPSVARLQ